MTKNEVSVSLFVPEFIFPDLRPGLRSLRDVGDHVRGHAGAGHPRDVHLPGHGRGLVPHEPGQSIKDYQKINVV